MDAIPRVQLHYFDAHSAAFETWLCELGTRHTVVITGMHLCGELSPRLVQLFNRYACVGALVLVPCCLSKKFPELKEEAKRLGVVPQALWAQHLHNLIDKKSQLVDTHQWEDPEVMSLQNTFICAVKCAYMDE